MTVQDDRQLIDPLQTLADVCYRQADLRWNSTLFAVTALAGWIPARTLMLRFGAD
jgi:hypothetical protein